LGINTCQAFNSTDSGIKRHDCLFVSWLWEYDADLPEWLLDCRSRIVYERKKDNQVFYFLPVEYILGKLVVVPVGDTGTIPYSMRQHAQDFVGAAFDTRESRCSSRWWYVNTWALGWSRERCEK